MNYKEQQNQYIADRDRMRPKDAKVAKLLGKPVACISGYWDPEAGNFVISIPEQYSENAVILDEEKYREAVDTYNKRRATPRDERTGECNLLKMLDYIDVKEMPWTPAIKDTGIGEGVEFCTNKDPNEKKWRWHEVPHYCESLDAVRELEEAIVGLGTSALMMYMHEQCKATSSIDQTIASIRASAEQKTDAAIAVFEKFAE